MRYHPRILTGEKNGHIAAIENDNGDVWEIHPLGDRKEREFYSLPAAEQLATAHAEIATRRGTHEGIGSLRPVL